MIDLNNIYYYYNNEIIGLKNINIHINKGESVAFIGPNGSGKSTLMKVINALIYPNKGKYFFDNEIVDEKRFKNDNISKLFHKRVGFVFQNSEVQLFCSKVYDEIAFGLQQMDMAEDKIKMRVNDVLKLLKIENLKDRIPYHLSGGEKKKVAIAAVLVLNPDVIVFDEPMNGLDPKTKRTLKELMIKLNSAGKTILCSTHDFSYVDGIFKRAVVLSENHTIIRDGSYQDIINDKEFLMENNIL